MRSSRRASRPKPACNAVDLIVQLKPLLGRNLQPEAFKAVRTVQDIVDVVHGLLPGQAAA